MIATTSQPHPERVLSWLINALDTTSPQSCGAAVCATSGEWQGLELQIRRGGGSGSKQNVGAGARRKRSLTARPVFRGVPGRAGESQALPDKVDTTANLHVLSFCVPFFWSHAFFQLPTRKATQNCPVTGPALTAKRQTATERRPHHRRSHATTAARRSEGGARPQRLPTSLARTQKRCGPRRRSSR